MGVLYWRVAFCALWLTSAAHAQYVATSASSVVYPNLSAPLPAMLTSASGLANDRGRADVALGFTFPFYDKRYSSITVTANGVGFLEPSSAAFADADFSANVAVMNVSEPNAVIALLWDDLAGTQPASALQYQQVNGPNGQGLAIEWAKWSYWTGSYEMTFQVRLWENGLIDFFYGSMTGSGSNLSATVGIESPNGGSGTQGRLCGSLCRLSDVPSNTQISFGPPAGVDLLLSRVKVNSVVPSGADLLISTSVAMRNFGTMPSGAFTYRLYLSANTTFEAGSDIPLGSAQGPLNLAAMGSTEHTSSNVVPRPASGSFYVLAVVDDTAQVIETNEVNNVGANPSPLSPGVDLVAQSITGPLLGGPGEVLSVNLELSNLGLDPAGAVPVDLWLSTDTTLSSNDVKLLSTSLTVAGGQNLSQAVSFTLPTNISGGDYHFILQVDHGPASGTVVETDDGNNVKASDAIFTARQADLVVDRVTVIDPAPPNLPAANAFFGEMIRVDAVVRNAGGATAQNVSTRFYLSDNDTLNGFSDPLMLELQGLTLAPGAVATVTATALVPTLSVSGVPLSPGNYYFFAAALAPNLSEVNSNNNAKSSGAQRVGAPAPDLLPLSVNGPSRVGAGEAVVVNRVFANRGNRPASNVSYRYYLSANALITPSDIPLHIVTASGLVDDAQFTLAAGQRDVGSDTVFVPATTPGATYYLGVLVDPPVTQQFGEVREIDEDNNGLATSTVDVAPLALALGPAPLPDAMVGLPYTAQLSGQGGNGNYVFGLAPQATLPVGLTLSSAGVLTGTPKSTGVHTLALTVTSQSRTVTALKVLRIVAASSSFTIVTAQLPVVARGVPYDAALAAAGGVGPYNWFIESGGLPAGLGLETNGSISGTCTAPLGTETSAVIVARDAVGNMASVTMRFTVVNGTALRLTASTLADATIGASFAADLSIENVDRSPVEKPVTWSVVQGALPFGLALDAQAERAFLEGTPSVAGLFAFTLEVRDAKGRSDSADFVMRVFPTSFVLQAVLPTVVGRGSQLDTVITMAPPVEGATFTVNTGALPLGLVLEPSGALHGTVDDAAANGRYTFTVEAGRDGSVDALATWTIEVSDNGAHGLGRCGCAASPNVGLLGALVWVWARRRR